MSDEGSRRPDRAVVFYACAASLWIGCSALLVLAADQVGGIPALTVGVLCGLALVAGTSLWVRDLLANWNRRLSSAAAMERRAAENVREVTRIRSAFLDSISHELRTPLTNILGFAQTIRAHHRTLEPENLEQFSDRLVVNTTRLERLVVDLLELHRGDPTVTAATEPVHVEQLLQGTIASTGPRSQRLYVWSPAQWVAIDRDKLERIVMELVGNVVRHTPADTVAWLQATTEGGWLHLGIEDDGPGVDRDIIDRVHQPFVQGAEARQSPSPGLGIGLALAARYAELLGGGLSISTPATGGTRVDVVLPYRDIPAPASS